MQLTKTNTFRLQWLFVCMGEENALNPSRVWIVLEGDMVMDGLANLPHAFCVLFRLTYALHLDSPKSMKHTLLLIQQVLLDLGKRKLPLKIQTLKNQLAACELRKRTFLLKKKLGSFGIAVIAKHCNKCCVIIRHENW